MEIGPYSLQVFTSLVVILGAAFVALICDYLKGNNERLRELTLELKVRREEERKRVELILPRVLASSAGAGAARREHSRRSSALLSERKRAAKPRLVETLTETEIEPQRIPEQVLVEAMAAANESRTDASPAASQPVTSQPVTRKKDWNSLLASRRVATQSQPPPAQSPLLTAVLEATASDQAKIAGPGLPAGFQDGFAVAELIAKKQPVCGLVMSIGVNTPDFAGGALPERVHHLMQSLLGAKDFATQSTPHEFLLIFPDERGAGAQRRLSQVAQQLWDFQLHSLGAQAVMFSWGGLEVRNEPIDEAIAAANERMQETRRGRKSQVGDAAVALDEPLSEAV